MFAHIGSNKLKLIIGDITEQQVDVIVNAANGTLLGGGGVDGAIHQKAGPKLLHACKQIRNIDLNGDLLETGQAVITKGYNLRAQYIIHTVGPIWGNEEDREEELLKKCYINALSLAKQYQLNSIAFPSISTGAYRYPIEQASKIALQTMLDFLYQTENKTIIITLFSKEHYDVYKNQLNQLLNN